MAYWGILVTPETSHKAKRHLRSMYETALAMRLDVQLFSEYNPCTVLMLYGLGGADRYPAAMEHKRGGKRFVTWDLGYWDRMTTPRTFRFSIDANHPKEVMQGDYLGPGRFESAELAMGNVAKDSGPILLIGNGPKAVHTGAQGWAASKSKELRRQFPGKQILYRPKPGKPIENGAEYDGLSHGLIDQALVGVSLVVTRHSNVAIDACRLGVPVVCDDGAGACIYPQRLEMAHAQPDEATRMQFLHRLAWWQWRADEAVQAWKFIGEQVCG